MLGSRQLALLISLICLLGAVGSPRAQDGAPQKRSSAAGAQVPAESPSTQIGDSGYKVAIPEIKLRSIIGGKATPKPPPEGAEAQPAPVPESPTREQPAEREPEKKVDRLPFDPVDVGQTEPVRVPETAPVTPSEPADAPQPEPERPAENTPAPRPSEPAPPAAPQEEPSPVYHPPVAPEETLDASFVPKKEVLRGPTPVKQIPISTLETRASKASRLEIAASESKELVSPEDWIALDARKSPLMVELPAEEKEEPQESLPRTARSPDASAPPAEATEAPTTETPTVTPPREIPSEPPQEEKPAQESLPREQLPVEKPPQTRAKEVIPSPLDDDALASREARDYLRETAPILEELSLLMTRAPGLSIEDYDPSDANSALVPADIRLKMTSLKRELQILDSKTFAIIPPSRYQAFHSLVRESIAHAYQACDAIINYFEENNPENFVKAKEHLVKAGELIRKTIKQGASSG
ncbi:MAG: hypothetical protein ACP5M0_03180 [Desulfomonilaceae bacterium]